MLFRQWRFWHLALCCAIPASVFSAWITTTEVVLHPFGISQVRLNILAIIKFPTDNLLIDKILHWVLQHMPSKYHNRESMHIYRWCFLWRKKLGGCLFLVLLVGLYLEWFYQGSTFLHSKLIWLVISFLICFQFTKIKNKTECFKLRQLLIRYLLINKWNPDHHLYSVVILSIGCRTSFIARWKWLWWPCSALLLCFSFFSFWCWLK